MLSLCGLLAGVLAAGAQTVDAIQGILPVTDPAMTVSLNGAWKLKVVEGITESHEVPPCDASWGEIPVPGCWEVYGFSQPAYDSPKPLTGFYRTEIAVPAQWSGQRIVLRLDGVLYGYDLWINGREVGSWRSAYNTALFDITPFIDRRKPVQQLAMRVITQFRGSDFDYNDDWTPCGIFRDVTLMAVPETHLADLTVRTSNSGSVEVTAEVAHADSKTVTRRGVWWGPTGWRTPTCGRLRRLIFIRFAPHSPEKTRHCRCFTISSDSVNCLSRATSCSSMGCP